MCCVPCQGKQIYEHQTKYNFLQKAFFSKDMELPALLFHHQSPLTTKCKRGYLEVEIQTAHPTLGTVLSYV